MYCLDSSIVIALFRGDKDIKTKINSLNPEDIYITTVSLCELFKGSYKKGREKSIALTEDLINSCNIVPLGIKSSRIFGIDFNELEKIGKKTQEADLMISSIAKCNNLILVTRNKKHFENISNLKIEEW